MPPASGTQGSRAAQPPRTTQPPRTAQPAATSQSTPPEPAAADDPVLTAERAYLGQAREYLRLMREDVLSLRALGGDPVSEEYLKADLYRRARALSDLPGTPLFFGRLDYATGEFAGERFHVGRRHVHDPEGHPVVVDWRAPVSRAFYRASPADPMGLALRRRFGCSGGDLTAHEDERFTGPAAAQPDGAPVSRILIEEIERPRSGPMRDIVATIAPDQDDIVRAEADQTLCVQGAPGTGKTAVGLHRVAYLLYTFAGRMTRGGVLVIGPNRAFLSYIRDVLPALGELDVTQTTVADLVARVPVREADPPQAARVKGDARMAEVLRRALWAGLATPAEPVVLARGVRRWRVSASTLTDLVIELQERGIRYSAGREMLGHRIAHVILTQMEAAGETCDDRTHESVRRSKPVRAAVDAIWPKADPVRLVLRLLSDPQLLAGAAGGLLDEAEQQAIRWDPAPRGPGSARWTAADAVLVDEASDLIERIPSLSHVVLDEAQDLSPMECRAVGRRCATGSATILGDLAQGTSPAATDSWPGLLAHLGKPAAQLRVLQTGYRVPRQILDYANQLLGALAPSLAPVRSLRQDPDALAVRPVAAQALPGVLVAACRAAVAAPGSAAVIAADDQVAFVRQLLSRAGLPAGVLDGVADGLGGAGLITVPVTLAKGLEFDDVIVVEPARIVAAEPRGLHRLYVALTRAVSRLTVVHAEPLPTGLG
jgi:DNA helicase IV